MKKIFASFLLCTLHTHAFGMGKSIHLDAGYESLTIKGEDGEKDAPAKGYAVGMRAQLQASYAYASLGVSKSMVKTEKVDEIETSLDLLSLPLELGLALTIGRTLVSLGGVYEYGLNGAIKMEGKVTDVSFSETRDLDSWNRLGAVLRGAMIFGYLNAGLFVKYYTIGTLTTTILGEQEKSTFNGYIAGLSLGVNF